MRLSRLVLLLFLVAQFWMAIFTWVAVDAHGVAAEGNWSWRPGCCSLDLRRRSSLRNCGAAAGGVLLYVRGVHSILAG